MANPYKERDLSDYTTFRKLFSKISKLGSGSDGTVYKFQHKRTKNLIAVKVPSSYALRDKPCKQLKREIANLQTVGKHSHIVTMLGYCNDFKPRGPAVMLELCDLGDLHSYAEKVGSQQLARGHKTSRVPENAIWKLLRDMGLALDRLHNETQGGGYIHSDLKPANILAKFPEAWKSDDGIPLEPTFQLTDFSRMQPFTPLSSLRGDDSNAEQSDIMIYGTPEYAPPLEEQDVARPSGDIWGLGATLQALALGVLPIQSRETFVAERKKLKLDYPMPDNNIEWNNIEWRALRSTVYRPISVSRDELEQNYDIHNDLWVSQEAYYEDWRPYSGSLNTWYTALWTENEGERITADLLVRYQVPGAEAEMAIARDMEAAELCLDKARKLRENVAIRRQGLGAR